ncbi:MAG: aldehyde dehydrogenase family protein [Pseudobdellovibrionaceae bacterium]
MQKVLNFVGGEWKSTENGQVFAKLNPHDGSDVASCADSEAFDVVKTLQSSKAAFATWSQISSEERANFLKKMAVVIAQNKDSWAQLEAIEQGLPIEFVKEHSFEEAIRVLNYWSNSTSESQESPLGVVAVVTSWCLGLRLLVERVAPALTAGNCVIAKPSEHAPSSGWVLGEAARLAELPHGVLNILQGDGEKVGSVLTAHPSIRAVAFAGKLAVGEKILNSTGSQFKRVHMSMGANNAALVLADADLSKCIPKIIESCLTGMGQMCWNTSRILVQESIYPEFVEKFKAHLISCQPLPLISRNQMEIFNQRKTLALSENAKLFSLDIKNEKGFWAEPTFSLDLPMCSVLQQDEISGPFFSISSVKYPHEMVKWTNTGYYGHSAQVWTQDPEKAYKWGSKLECGTVWVNDWMKGVNEGHVMKQSGFGRVVNSALRQFFSYQRQIIAKF